MTCNPFYPPKIQDGGYFLRIRFILHTSHKLSFGRNSLKKMFFWIFIKKINSFTAQNIVCIVYYFILNSISRFSNIVTCYPLKLIAVAKKKNFFFALCIFAVILLLFFYRIQAVNKFFQ